MRTGLDQISNTQKKIAAYSRKILLQTQKFEFHFFSLSLFKHSKYFQYI